MIIYSYELVTTADQEPALLAALADLAEQLTAQPECRSTLLLRDTERLHVFRFDEQWDSLAAHDASTADPKPVMKTIFDALTDKPKRLLLAPVTS